MVRVLYVETTQRRLSRVGHCEETLREALQAMTMIDHGKMLSNLERRSIKLLPSSFHKHEDDKRLYVRIMVILQADRTTSLKVKASKKLFHKRMFSAHSWDMSLFACSDLLL